MSVKNIAIIPARYASVRFPGKPLVQIMGKTLLQRTYENACRSSLVDEIIIATDDLRIFEHANNFGAKVVMTSDRCMNGTDRIAEVLHLHPDYLKASIIVNVQGDEPCIDPEAINQVIQLLAEDSQAVMSTVATRLTTEDEAFSPSIVKCVMDKHMNATYFSRALIPSNKTHRFDPHTTYFRHVGLYAYRPSFVLTYQTLSPTPLQVAEDLEQLKVLEHGYRIKVALVDQTSPGVDTPEDIQTIEQWICKQNTSLSQAESVPH